MKKLVSMLLVAAMLLCGAFAEDMTAEVTIEPSFEGQYAEVDTTYGLLVYVPADWAELEAPEGCMFAYGNDEIAMVTAVLEADINAIYETYSVDADYTGFGMVTVNGNTWLVFSSADDLMNMACMTYEEGTTLVIEFDTAAPMGDSTIPVEILGTITTKDALAQ